MAVEIIPPQRWCRIPPRLPVFSTIHHTMKYILLLSALAAFTFAGAQDKKSDKKTDKKPSADAKPAADAKTTDLEAGGLTFKAPAPWTAKAKPGPMSAGGVTIPGKEGAAGVQADFYHFAGPTGGGDKEANVQRWQRAFVPDEDGNLPVPTREEVEIAGKKVFFATFKGTYLGGSSLDEDRPKLPGYTMIGIIVPTDEAPVFIRAYGPEAAMTAAADQIKALVKSAFPAAK